SLLGADSLEYISYEGMIEVMSKTKAGFCAACYTGEYPVPIEEDVNKNALDRGKLKKYFFN
ncbi:MAG: amidophosphoribosyltransferase, partial [Chlamydiota bacterium]|nr:amidophosphoribosyltransferase [Chlamydiota bacterium]